MTHVRHLTPGELREDRCLRHYTGYFADAERDLLTLEELINSPRAADVWRAAENFGIIPPWFVFHMVGIVRKSLDGFALIAITQKERKRAALKVQRLALQLSQELSNPVVVSCLQRAREDCRRLGTLPKSRFVHPDPDYFAALAVISAEMARQPKVIGQPNNENAHRLYFIRSVTDGLHKLIKTPMRSLVFALTSVFFDVSGLSVNDLANLAPVKKLSKNPAVGSPEKTR